MSDTSAITDREGVIAVPGTANFREIGPLARIRPGVVWRADGLADLGDAGRAALAALGLRTVVDLRQAVEREQHPDDTAGLGVRVEQIEVLGDDFDALAVSGLGDIYAQIVDERGAELARAVRLIADPSLHPLVVHCSAGKDRTGIVSALVLDLVGVPRDEIAADYARTSELLRGPVQDRVKRQAVEAGLDEQRLAVAMDSPAGVMAELLLRLDRRHGGTRAYLAAHGVTDADVDALRRALLRSAGDAGA